MDIFYSVKQLAHEIAVLEASLAEKKATIRKLWGTLSPQEQAQIGSHHAPPESAPEPPKSPKKPPG